MQTALIGVYLAIALMEITLGAPADTTGPLVTLRNGRIRGGYLSVKGTDKRVEQYLAVPFAQPPVGPLRLAAPQPARPWEGERDGTHQPPMCVQNPAIALQVAQIMSIQYSPPEVSEDCLYLNVYTPAGAATGEKLPVMVWIHGGGLSMGAASQFDASPLAAYQNIVVVVIQYRLGILGFLSTGDVHAQGNWGFLDQIEALKWVQQNIRGFGGDPHVVTVAGESAGGISASILTLSPLAKGLFHRVIFQSGVATVGPYTTKYPLANTKIVANLTDCELVTTEQFINCLRAKTQDDLISATIKMRVYLGGVVDGVFLTDVAEELLKRKEVMNVPVVLGFTNHEFGWILPQTFAPPGWQNGMDRQSALTVVNMFYPSGASGELIADEYLKNAKTREEIRDEFTEMLGDIFMVLPILKVAGYHRAAGAPVYLYEFIHRPEAHKLTRPAFVKSDHADEIGFIFGGCFWDGHIKIMGTVTEEEIKLCKTMMAYWANFVRTGSPNGPGLVQWPLYENQTYMELGLQQKASHDLKKDKIQFLTVTLPQKLARLAASGGRGN